MAGALVLPEVTNGKIEASTTRKPLDAVHLQLGIDHIPGSARAHTTGADRVKDREAAGANVRNEIGVPVGTLPRLQFRSISPCIAWSHGELQKARTPAGFRCHHWSRVVGLDRRRIRGSADFNLIQPRLLGRQGDANDCARETVGLSADACGRHSWSAHG